MRMPRSEGEQILVQYDISEFVSDSEDEEESNDKSKPSAGKRLQDAKIRDADNDGHHIEEISSTSNNQESTKDHQNEPANKVDGADEQDTTSSLESPPSTTETTLGESQSVNYHEIPENDGKDGKSIDDGKDSMRDVDVDAAEKQHCGGDDSEDDHASHEKQSDDLAQPVSDRTGTDAGMDDGEDDSPGISEKEAQDDLDIENDSTPQEAEEGNLVDDLNEKDRNVDEGAINQKANNQIAKENEQDGQREQRPSLTRESDSQSECHSQNSNEVGKQYGDSHGSTENDALQKPEEGFGNSSEQNHSSVSMSSGGEEAHLVSQMEQADSNVSDGSLNPQMLPDPKTSGVTSAVTSKSTIDTSVAATADSSIVLDEEDASKQDNGVGDRPSSPLGEDAELLNDDEIEYEDLNDISSQSEHQKQAEVNSVDMYSISSGSFGSIDSDFARTIQTIMDHAAAHVPPDRKEDVKTVEIIGLDTAVGTKEGLSNYDESSKAEVESQELSLHEDASATNELGASDTTASRDEKDSLDAKEQPEGSDQDSNDTLMELPSPKEPGQSDLIEMIRTSSWQQLLKGMEKLRKADSAIIYDELTANDHEKRRTSLHHVVASAPLSLAKLLISLIPYESRREILLYRDIDGNTALHLACANLKVKDDGTIDDSVVKVLSIGAPEAHYVKNKLGDIPLFMLVSSMAFRSAQDTTVGRTSTVEHATELTRYILKERSDLVEIQNNKKKNLLHIASAFGVHGAVFDAVLGISGAGCRLQDAEGRLPLHYLASSIHGPNPPCNIVAKFIELYPDSVVASCVSGDTPLHLFLSNISANMESEHIGSDVDRMAEFLLGNSDDPSLCPLVVKNTDGLNPLHCGALFSAPASTLRILQTSPFFKTAAMQKDQNGATPLHLLCGSSSVGGLVEEMEVLGSPSIAEMKDEEGRTPLHVVAENHYANVRAVQRLLEMNPDVAQQENQKGRLPAHVAITKNPKEAIVRLILKAHPDAIKSVFKGGHTIFHEMCQHRVPAPLVEVLIQLYPEGPSKQNKFKNLPLHVATAYQCEIETIKALAQAYPQACLQQNKRKDVPLHYATLLQKRKDVVKFLVDFFPLAVQIKNADGKTPLDNATENGLEELVRATLNGAQSQAGTTSVEKQEEASSKDTPSHPESAKEQDEIPHRGRQPSTDPSPRETSEERRSRKREKSLDRSRSREHSRERSSRKREKSVERSRKRDKSVERSSRKREKSVERGREKSVERSARKREKSVERSSRKRDKSVDKSREKSVERSGRKRDKSVDKSRDKSVDRSSRKRDKSRDRSREKSVERSERKREKSVERRGRKRDKSVDKSDTSRSKSAEKRGRSKSKDRSSRDKSVERRGRRPDRTETAASDLDSSKDSLLAPFGSLSDFHASASGDPSTEKKSKSSRRIKSKAAQEAEEEVEKMVSMRRSKAALQVDEEEAEHEKLKMSSRQSKSETKKKPKSKRHLHASNSMSSSDFQSSTDDIDASYRVEDLVYQSDDGGPSKKKTDSFRRSRKSLDGSSSSKTKGKSRRKSKDPKEKRHSSSRTSLRHSKSMSDSSSSNMLASKSMLLDDLLHDPM